MSVINIGSINIDILYQTPHLVAPGETITSTARQQGLGGKGMNQSIALHRAGVNVIHVGCIGKDDAWTLAQIDEGLSTSNIARCDEPTGHAVIELSAEGENRIILFPGANHQLSRAAIQSALSDNPDSAYVLLQNETNLIAETIEIAHSVGKTVVFNPAPCDASLRSLPLEKVGILIVNEIELQQLADVTGIDAAISALRQRYPDTALVITLGAEGVRYEDNQHSLVQPAAMVEKVVDTTGAGDTFIGYFLAGLSDGLSVQDSLLQGVHASAVTISRLGAAGAIPHRSELSLSLND